MGIWKKTYTIEQLNETRNNTIHTPLGIVFTKVGENFLEASMPVDHRTCQPAGILHGGASAVLAESLGSVASFLMLSEHQTCVGIEINASHLSSIRRGKVIGRVTPIRIGKLIHVWDIRIRDEACSNDIQLICQSRLTVMIRDKR